LLRVVANQAKNHVRGQARRRRRDEHHARLAVRSIEGADETADRRLEHEVVAAALGRLAQPDREVLGCRFVAGLGESETAEVLGIPIGTVKSRMSRALDRLAQELGPALVADSEGER
jgi:RNA polymerase sigma-70 factor (ECF subfamily)